MKGIVKWYNIRKGFGFIQGEDGRNVFVHKSCIPFWNIYLSTGEKVEYELQQSNKGLQAKNLKTI
jgi:cold shock protein